MEPQNQSNDLLDFFKALGDAERLKIAGLLANAPFTLDELAQRTSLRPLEVSNHLEQLEAQGLVLRDGPAYRLAANSLEKKARSVLAQSRLRANPEDFEGDAYDRKVLADYFKSNGRLKALPTQHKKLMVVLRHLVKNFTPGVRYPEKQVNEILFRFHEDYAALRRYMVDNKLMARERGEYWVI
jgi:DNA-binding HxlR family transcriptional regulator